MIAMTREEHVFRKVIFERFSLVLLMPRSPRLRQRFYSQVCASKRRGLFVSEAGDDIHRQLEALNESMLAPLEAHV